VPLVIASRIRRTADPQVLLMQAFALYVSFLGAAWFKDPALLRDRWGLLRLAIPTGIALVGLILDDAYAVPGIRSPLSLVRGPVIGLGLALVSQAMLWNGRRDLALPRWILFYGCAMSWLLTSAIRMLFPPVTHRLQGVNAPALWLKQASASKEDSRGLIPGVKLAAAIAVAAILFVAIQFLKRG